MRLLHTSDWHVGKRIRGHSRADEHRAVLAEIAEVADREAVDLILVAGDLYETAAPTPESERIVNQALLRLAEVAPVLAVAGNHDNPRRLAAVEPLLRLGRITMVAEPLAPDQGGCVELVAGDTPVRAAMLPFVSQRAIVRAEQLMANAAYENAQAYAERLRWVIEALCQPFDADHVNLVVAHAFVTGGMTGGGERAAHLVDEYGLSAVDFPPSASYVALGHLHRPQQMLGATAIHYCGSPLQLDFGEQDQAKQVNIVDAEPGIPAKVTSVPLTSGRRLRTLTGTVAQLQAMADRAASAGDGEEPNEDADRLDAWLRVRITEPGRAGLAEEVRAALGERVVDVRVEAMETPRPVRHRDGRDPRELFAAYLAEAGLEDPAVVSRFVQLLDEAGTPADGDETAGPADRVEAAGPADQVEAGTSADRDQVEVDEEAPGGQVIELDRAETE
ncbi:MAG: exonuclease SbcCD subunit D, partial [Actinomycetota bacterium]